MLKPILLVEDDKRDLELTLVALERSQLANEVVVVRDGALALDYLLREGWADMVGIGRAVLSYPAMLADAAMKGELEKRLICRTFSDCTTAPRNGIISGCYPLDKFYTAKPEAAQLKEIKKRVGA